MGDVPTQGAAAETRAAAAKNPAPTAVTVRQSSSSLPIMTDPEIASVRKQIIDMMEASWDLEHSDDVPTIRYYKMTEQEYQQTKKNGYLFAMFLSKFPDNTATGNTTTNRTEGFAYDVLRLLQEKWLSIDDIVCYLPIPLSVQRWNWLMVNRGQQKMGQVSFRTGKLTFPLYRRELTSIMQKLADKAPLLCSSAEGCLCNGPDLSIEDLQAVTALRRLPDISNTVRFGTATAALDSQVAPVQPVVQHTTSLVVVPKPSSPLPPPLIPAGNAAIASALPVAPTTEVVSLPTPSSTVPPPPVGQPPPGDSNNIFPTSNPLQPVAYDGGSRDGDPTLATAASVSAPPLSPSTGALIVYQPTGSNINKLDGWGQPQRVSFVSLQATPSDSKTDSDVEEIVSRVEQDMKIVHADADPVGKLVYDKLRSEQVKQWIRDNLRPTPQGLSKLKVQIQSVLLQDALDKTLHTKR